MGETKLPPQTCATNPHQRNIMSGNYDGRTDSTWERFIKVKGSSGKSILRQQNLLGVLRAVKEMQKATAMSLSMLLPRHAPERVTLACPGVDS